MQAFLASDQNVALLLLRVALGVIILPHGMQKLAGWWGGAGLKATLATFKERRKTPAPVTLLVIVGESFGSVALVLGLLTRFDAFAVVLTQLGAIVMVHWRNGFFAGKNGYEFNLLLLVVGVVVMIYGPGPLAVDGWLAGMLH